MADNEYNTGSYGSFTGTFTSSGSSITAIRTTDATPLTTFSTQGFSTGRYSDTMRQKQLARIRLLDTLNKL